MTDVAHHDTASDPSGGRLGHDLEAIALRAANALRERRTRAAALESCDRMALALLCTVPAAQLFALGIARLAGLESGKLPIWSLLLSTLALPFGYIFFRAYRVAGRRASRTTALATVDRELRLKDRLVTAAEFLSHESRTAFQEAALEDAARYTQTALERELAAQPVTWSAGRGFGPLAVLAVALLGAALILDLPTRESDLETARGGVGGLSPELATRDSDESDETPEPPAATPEEEEPKGVAPEKGQPTEPGTGENPGQMSDEAKKTRGRTKSGQASQAAFASGASDSRGVPSAQGQSSLPSQEKNKKKAKKKPKKRSEEKAVDTERKPEKQSGATAGRGQASGSSRSPGASEWSSKDQVVSDEDEELEDEEDVDDEFDDSDARGGLQPNLRDRKPPVNRDLSISYGNQKDPDANGRGGQSEQKKSRGVASLVLGVPISDHVKGKPNPGRTKVTQERVEPRPEDSAEVAASPRTPRSDPVGHLRQRDLLPWMREYLETYYLSIRAETPKKTEQPKE